MLEPLMGKAVCVNAMQLLRLASICTILGLHTIGNNNLYH